MTNAPDRIWIAAFGGNWSAVKGGTQDVEYVRADRAETALAAQPSPDVAALVEALEALIQQTYDCEKELTEVLHHIDFCGESEPLAKARAALARVKGGAA